MLRIPWERELLEDPAPNIKSDPARLTSKAKNDLNPVTGAYYDSTKEEHKKGEELEEQLTHGMHSMDIYPPRMK